MVMENGQRVVEPMRYHCRPAGKPAFYDEKYPITDRARRANLRGFWNGQYGYTHGLVLVDAFYEYVGTAPTIRRRRLPRPGTTAVRCRSSLRTLMRG